MANPLPPTRVRIPADSVVPIVLGAVWIVAGGLVSAASARTASYHTSWAVAYIVLVAGAAQVVLGLGQAVLGVGRSSPRVLGAEYVAWNLGNIAVLAGVLLDIVPVLYVGCALLVYALASAFLTTRHAPQRRLLLAFQVVVGVLLVSIPVGVVLQALRAAH